MGGFIGHGKSSAGELPGDAPADDKPPRETSEQVFDEVRLARQDGVAVGIFVLAWCGMIAWLYLRRDIILMQVGDELHRRLFWGPQDSTHVGALHDPLLAVGLFMTLLGLMLSVGIEGSIVACLRTIAAEKTVVLPGLSVAHIFRRIWAPLWSTNATIGMVVIASTVFFIYGGILLWPEQFGCRFEFPTPSQEAWFPWIGHLACHYEREFLIAATILGGMAGYRLGVLRANARLFARITRQKVILHLVPGHPDTAGGTASLGNLVLYAIFLISFTVVALSGLLYCTLFLWNDRVMPENAWLIGALLALALVYAVVAVYRPFRRFSVLIQERKRDLESRIFPGIDRRLEEIAQKSAATTDPKHLTDLLKEAVELLGQRQTVRGLPVWPIGTIGRRILSTGFVFALLPWALKVTYPSLKDLADFLGILLKSLS